MIDAQDIAKGLGKYSKTAGGFVAPCPAHNDRNPSLSVSDSEGGKILVHCHAGCDQLAVVDALKKRNLWPEAERREPAPKPKRQPATEKRIVAVYDYADPTDGEIKMQVVRYDPKDFRQRRPDGKGGWLWSVGPEHRILYNLPAVQNSDKLVCIVEGEKDVDRLASIGIVATCNPGGAGKWQDSYSEALRGRSVLLIPDNDPQMTRRDTGELMWHADGRPKHAGQDHMDMVGAALQGIAKSVKIVHLPDLPLKGDVSDWIDAGGDRKALGTLYTKAPVWEPPVAPQRAERAAEPQMERVERFTPDIPPEDDGDTPFRPLGFNKGTYYYLALGTKQIVELGAPAHTKGNLLGLAPLSYWEREYPAKTSFNTDAAANDLMRMCERRGIFSPEMMRGRGAWFDDGKVVLHLGNILYVDRQPTDPVKVKSRFVYEQGLPMRADIDGPLSVAEAGRFLKLMRMMPWERDIEALYAAGWCVLAHIGGVLNWRPHIWVVGSKGSGKTHVMSQVILPILGDNRLFVAGETTEAGVRQSLGHDALPVLFDEAEGEDTRATERLQRILALVRQSSSETGGKIAKGTVGGAAMTFNVRSCFAFSSINASLVQQSDRSRVTVIELKPEKRKHGLEELVAAEADILTEAYISSFYARAIHLAPVIRHNAIVFAKAVAGVMGEQRAGDQLGALLAGAYSLTSDEKVTFEAAEKWVRAKDWTDTVEEVQGMSDENNLISFLMQQTLRVQSDHGARDFTIGELVDMAKGMDYNVKGGAQKELMRAGIKVEDDGMHISNTSSKIATMLRPTPWSTNWSKVLRRLQGSRSSGVIYFGFHKSEARATWVPF